MTHPKPYPLLANRILRKAARAQQAIAKHKQRMTQGLEAYANEAHQEQKERTGFDMTISVPMSFSVVFAASEEDLRARALARMTQHIQATGADVIDLDPPGRDVDMPMADDWLTPEQCQAVQAQALRELAPTAGKRRPSKDLDFVGPSQTLEELKAELDPKAGEPEENPWKNQEHKQQMSDATQRQVNEWAREAPDLNAFGEEIDQEDLWLDPAEQKAMVDYARAYVRSIVGDVEITADMFVEMPVADDWLTPEQSDDWRADVRRRVGPVDLTLEKDALSIFGAGPKAGDRA